METKAYAFLVIALVVGLIGGYLVGLIPLQQQINVLQLRLDEQDQTITELQTSIGELEATVEEQDFQIGELEGGIHERNEHIGFLNEVIAELEAVFEQKDSYISFLEEIIHGLEAEINNLRIILLTEIQIDNVEWNVNDNVIMVTVRNTGNYSTLVEFISVKRNVEGSTFITQEVLPPAEIAIEETAVIYWGGPDAGLTIQQGDSYVVRVTCSTGFFYEIIISIPAPQEPPEYTQIRILSVTWDANADTATILVKNTGTQTATIESISAYTNAAGWMEDNSTDATGTLEIGQTGEFVFDAAYQGWDVRPGDEFIIRVTCTTGFYAETFSTVPGQTQTNLVQNGGFETGDLTGWNPSVQNENVTVVSGVAYGGSYSLGISGHASVGQTLSQTTTSKLTFWARCSNSSESYIVIFVYGPDESGSITIGPIGASWSYFEVLPSFAWDAFSLSTTDTADPVNVYPEQKLIDNVSISP